LLLIGALALLFSVAVLLENSTPVDAPDGVTASALPCELAPSVSSSSTDVVDHIPKEEPRAIIEVGLTPVPQTKREVEEDKAEAVEETSIEELLENRPPPEPVIEEAPLSEEEAEEIAGEEQLPPLPEPKEKQSRVYIVQKNDSFWKIAYKVWGKGSEWKKIWEANRDICPRPNSLRPGLKLMIPDRGEEISMSPSSQKSPAETRVPVPGRHYIVQKGDVLSIIAQKAYGRALLWRKILNANRDVLPDEWSLRPGMKLFIPRLK